MKRKYGSKRRIGTYKSNSKRVYKHRMARRVFTKRVKRVIMRTAERKQYEASQENIQLYHNVGPSVAYPSATNPYAIYMNPLGLQQGAVSGTRIGDKVQSTGLKLKLWISNKLDRPNVMYRILVLSHTDNAMSSGGAYANFIGVNQQIFTNATKANAMLGIVNTDNFTTILDRIVQPINQSGIPATQKEHSHMFQFWLPTKRTITYRDATDDTSVTRPKNARDNWAIYVIPYDAFGTLVTDNIATVAYAWRHYFRDV